MIFVYLVILLAALLGQDILLEPFGGEAFGLSVQQTTRITSIWGVCVLAADLHRLLAPPGPAPGALGSPRRTRA